MRFFALSCLFLLTLSGCASSGSGPHPILTGGERINIEYTCRTPNGELAATSRRDMAEDPTLPHSPLFNPLNTYLPASDSVPQPQDATHPLAKTMCFEEMLELLLTRQSLGAPLDTPQTVTLAGELIPGLTKGDRFLNLNLAYRTPRQVTITLNEFKELFKTTPVIKNQYNTETTGLSVTVNDVDDNNVTITYDVAPGTFIPSPFGPEMITQTDDSLEFRTDAKIGTLVHSGPIVGRITEVNDVTFVIDYGHSFAYTPLTCDVVFHPYISPDGLSWLDNINTAVDESAKTGRLVLVHFHDQWSGPNRSFLTEILPNPKIIAATKGYIRVRVNSVGRFSLLKKYEITTLPSVLIMNGQGKVLKKFSGLPETETFADELIKINSELN